LKKDEIVCKEGPPQGERVHKKVRRVNYNNKYYVSQQFQDLMQLT